MRAPEAGGSREIGDLHALRGRDHVQPAPVELAVRRHQHDRRRLRDHGALDLGLERVRVGQEALGRDALDREHDAIGVEALDRAHRLGAHERLRERAERAAEADELEVRALG